MAKTKNKSDYEERKRKRKALLMIFGWLVSVASVALLYSAWQSPGTSEYNIYLVVGSNTGFVAPEDALYFGTLMPSGSSQRFIQIRNDGNEHLESTLSFEGNATQFISAQHVVLLGAHENATVEINASIPADTAYGVYNGKLVISSRTVSVT